jgi:hypothetical protein
MFALNLVSRGKFALPHRRMTEGETIARIEFASEDDSMWFQRTLRWNAFGFVKAPAIEGHVVNGDGSRTPMETGEVITADLFDLLAGASPEDLAQLKGLGPKKAAELIENAQAFVAARAEAQAEADAKVKESQS